MGNYLAIKLEQVSKRIKGQVILDRVNMEVPQGKIYGIIGRNASGKTMLFRIICGLVRPSEGRVEVFGKVVGKDGSLPQQVGAIIEAPGFLPQYSGRRNLQLLASIRGVIGNDRIDEVLRAVGLEPRLRKPVRTYSTGMKQRLGIAQAVMEDPELLILDEPTNGLDTGGVKILREIVSAFRKEGKTVFLSSHINEDIETLCDTVYRIENGKVHMQR
jgi:ABC-2 type transport system ATP-binding protein